MAREGTGKYRWCTWGSGHGTDDGFWKRRKDREGRDGRVHQLCHLGEGLKENSSARVGQCEGHR